METKIEIPVAALLFGSKDKASINLQGDRLDMVIYSGALIRDHWHWGNLSIDLEGMSFPKKKYPILENHRTDRKIGFSGKPSINGNLKLNPDTVTFLDTEASLEFRKLSKEGFPYESSMYAKPTVIERVEEGAAVEVNRMTVKGPATVWRKSVFKEASVCVFGWDSRTEASAFSKDILELAVDIQGFDEDSVLADWLFSLTQAGGGQPNPEETLSDEDERTVNQLLSLADNANDLVDSEDEEDDALAEKLFQSAGGNRNKT